MLGDGIERVVREVLRRVGVLRVGLVTDVNTAGTLKRVKVDGRSMITLVDAVQGDHVVYWTGRPPIAIGSPIESP